MLENQLICDQLKIELEQRAKLARAVFVVILRKIAVMLLLFDKVFLVNTYKVIFFVVHLIRILLVNTYKVISFPVKRSCC